MGRKKLFYEPLKANQKGRRDVEGRRSTLVTAKESPEPMERPRSSSTQNARGTTLSRGIQERSTGPSSTVASTARAWSKRRPQKFMRAVTGATLADIMAKRNQKPEVRKAQREQAVRAAKEKKEAKEAKKEKKLETAKTAKTAKPKVAKAAAPKAPKVKTAGGKR